ncbi:hypothetical protein BZG02_20060 [Labilibaculum filiforme]|uniref:Uncharacterized protein n=1 Tax=Labilibaculum filiforme TaxID=1940526 RepID=A0A2N3HQB2_9BACT|nr:hypothetical protein [Labilibaculum filiforme]PKQ60242.1 hypothetical protein BZG02_20060 [Labilibaculum filiforme]
MKIFEVKQSELKEITLFLIEKKIILHPLISPDGIPDFTGYENKKIEIILDRNIFVYLLSLLENGRLNDNYKRKIISSLMFWIEFNSFSLNSGIALSEYADFKNDNISANQEHNIVNKLFIDYTPKDWLDLALARRETIKKVNNVLGTENKFHVESSHFKMHYLEMLKLAQLYYNEEISIIEKYNLFFDWIYKNIIICQYTICLSAKILSGKSKVFSLKKINFKELNKFCTNQAWDLTYLSTWSTFYWYEKQSEKIYLFATADKELREIFTLTNMHPDKIFSNYFGKNNGKEIELIMKKVYLPRKKRDINDDILNELIEIERNNLENQINIKYGL